MMIPTTLLLGAYTRDLTTGAQSLAGTYGAGIFISYLLVQPIPEPATTLFCGIVTLAAAMRRRRA